MRVDPGREGGRSVVRIRRDVASLGPGWNPTLLNYALAMRELDELPIGDRGGWKFLGAMHGFDRDVWIDEGLIDGRTAVPQEIVDGPYGNQCQHGSWYFLSWHRGYLAAFEAIVAAKVEELTGDDDWALPYWNYLDAGSPDARRVPEALLADSLPDGTPNPLSKYPRRPGLTELRPGPRDAFGLDAMEEDDFLVGNDGSIGFGGGISGDFLQFAGWTGDLENNPHNTVHRLVGGPGGFMGDPRLAGLDPIFWLHHCNVDRLWEAWMRAPGKSMVRDPRWLNGPADRKFIVPAPGGGDPGITFSGRDVLQGGRFHPNYDDLTKGTGVTPGGAAVVRVGMGPSSQQRVETIGASDATVSVGAAPARARVDLEPEATAAGVVALGATTPGEEVVRLYLALESVRGTAPAPLLEVYVNLPDGADPEAHPDLHAGSITLFGLNVASAVDGRHGGNGLGFTLDITELTGRLSASGGFDSENLRITLVPGEGITEEQPVTVERISILKRRGVVS